MSTERFIRSLALVFATALFLRALHWYPLLPDPFPIHFNGAGEADGWARKSPVTWGLMVLIGPLLATGLWFLATRMPRMAAQHPELINLPDKAGFLRLDTSARADAMRPTALYLRVVSGLLLALFLYIIEGTGRMATGAWSTLPSWPVFVFIGGVVGGLPLLLRATRKAMDR